MDRTTEREIAMWLEQHPKGRMRILLASTVAMLIMATGIAGAVAGTGRESDEDAQMIADAKRTELAIVAAWNDKKWDELAPLYAEDALVLPPNHEPVQGRDAIMEFFKSVRDVAGAIDDDFEHIRVKASGTVASLTGYFTTQSGHVRMTYADLYERQADGSVLMAVNQFGLRERAVG